jgi:putative DNA primase/helicase
MSDKQKRYDLAEIRKAIGILYEPGQIVEVRMMDKKKKLTAAGWFDDMEIMAKAVAKLARDGFGDPKGYKFIHENVFWTCNPVHDALLARQPKNTISFVDAATSDQNVLRRRWIPVDIDPQRPSGVSATNEEKKAARLVANQLGVKLGEMGFPDSCLVGGDSGNGYHLLIRCDLPNDKESLDLVKLCLEAMQAMVGNDKVEIDPSVCNAARIIKCYGTLACKGIDDEKRPWRMARLPIVPEKIEPCSRELLEKLAALSPEKRAKKPVSEKSQGSWNEENTQTYLDWTEWDWQTPTEYKGGKKWIGTCPGDSQHKDAAVILNPDGWWNFTCYHSSCKGLTNDDFKEFFEEKNGKEYRYPKSKRRAIDTNSFDVEDSPEKAKVVEHQTAGIDEPFNLTDIGNMERLVWRHGSKLKHAAALGWLVWDGTRWEQDETGRAERFAWNTVRKIPEEAGLVKAAPTPENEKDPDGEKAAESRRKAIFEWAHVSETGGHVALMLKHTQSAMGIASRVADFDQDTNLLNTKTGTIDLTTGEMRPHDREDMLTKVAPVEYDPATECPLWEKFVLEIMDGRRHMADFLQRALGYSLTGETVEHCILVLWGTGANGKSTFLEAVRHVMGDYAQAAEFGTFVAKKEARTGPSSDIAKMRGARFVSATEGEQQHKLAESLVKQLTGGDTIAACFKFKEYFEFRPQFKLWLATNHKPIIGGTDDGIWRRIRLVPFTVSFADRDDKQLSDKLRREAPGILRWMVEGLRQWRENGLMPPKEVLDATAQYRADEDLLMRFVADECEVGRGHETPARALYDRYKDWARRNHEQEMSERKFADGMKEHRWAKKATSTGRVYLGVKLAETRTGNEMFEDERVL